MIFGETAGVVLLVVIGAVVSWTVWIGGYLVRKRVRGPARVMLMTALVVTWYGVLFNISKEPGWDMHNISTAYKIAIHSIWIWWVLAIGRWVYRIKKQAGRSNWKTGIYKSTGLHRITKEHRIARERKVRETERAPTPPKPPEPPKSGSEQASPAS